MAFTSERAGQGHASPGHWRHSRSLGWGRCCLVCVVCSRSPPGGADSPAMRAWGAGAAVRPVWSAVRPALMVAQVCSVLVISLVSTASRLPPWYTAHALLVAAFVASMGATFAFSEPLLAVPERGIKNRVRYFSSLVGYSEVVTLVLLWLRAAGRWAGMWTHIGDLEGRLWGRGERHLPRLRSHTRAVTCVFLIVHIPQEASIVWRRLASVSSLYDLGQMTCSLCILLVFNVSAMLLVVLSDMLAECFRALTAKLHCASKKNGGQIPPGVVEDVRVLYNEVRRLTDALDDILGAILLVMLFADGLFICRFLLHWFTSG
ncbi:uncharacterized protein LOC113218288 isoform X7 [Frankliniella occidentalis]|uniref:Uncharacterized protein LOC113218288 isoform X7 n=1 Tax=Frankliniella occidentalis TaxID=133901 RepID=A0A9C6XAI2_FRAOC|nr:uncharacterized protein LOC113218288 isoform X7 [Frankliniella occidentalis]